MSGGISVARLNSLPLVAELARAVAALRIMDEDLVPSDVSALLGCEPTKGWAKGDTLTSHGVTRTARFGMWSLQADESEPAVSRAGSDGGSHSTEG
jgi:hypothetical protein